MHLDLLALQISNIPNAFQISSENDDNKGTLAIVFAKIQKHHSPAVMDLEHLPVDAFGGTDMLRRVLWR